MDKKMGQKVRMVRELKGFSQEYMAHALGMRPMKLTGPD